MNAVPMSPVTILVAEDNNLDRMILREAFDEVGMNVELRFVANGQELLDYLCRRHEYGSGFEGWNWPALVLLDLNMPRMNGTEALRQIRADPNLRAVPVMILSTSDNAKQIKLAYASGANAFMTKPGHFDDLVQAVRNFGNFWLGTARLPIGEMPA